MMSSKPGPSQMQSLELYYSSHSGGVVRKHWKERLMKRSVMSTVCLQNYKIPTGRQPAFCLAL